MATQHQRQQPGPGGGFSNGQQQPPPTGQTGPEASLAQSPLLRIRAGIEAGSPEEVLAGVRDADVQGVTLAENVRTMITQWLSVNKPTEGSPGAGASPAGAPQALGGHLGEESVRPGEGARNWSSQKADDGGGQPAAAAGEAGGAPGRPKGPKISPELLRMALLRFFEGAPKGSDSAAGLGIMETEDGSRYLPLPLLGRALGLAGQDFEVAQAVWHEVTECPAGTFILSDDARGCGLVEWAGWEEFSGALAAIAKGTRDPAFEPRSIQGHVARAARGAVRAGPTRKDDVLRMMKESLSPQDIQEDATPALRSAISRRARLALACLADAIASQGLGPQAGPDSMGLVGQLPRTLFGLIFDRVDDRDRGACAFLGEILGSWDRRRCFSKRWLQEARDKFTVPKGANSERDEGRGWYALTAENLHKQPKEDPPPRKEDPPPKRPKVVEEPSLPPVAVSVSLPEALPEVGSGAAAAAGAREPRERGAERPKEAPSRGERDHREREKQREREPSRREGSGRSPRRGSSGGDAAAAAYSPARERRSNRDRDRGERDRDRVHDRGDRERDRDRASGGGGERTPREAPAPAPEVASGPTAEQRLAALLPSGGSGGGGAGTSASGAGRGERGDSSAPKKRGLHEEEDQGSAAAAPAPAPRAAATATSASVPAAGKKRAIQEEEDDEAVARHLEASRKRRAELLQKYKA